MYAECRHIMPHGTKCKSPALRGKFYCYYHQKLHIYTQDGTRGGNEPLYLPPLEDARGIQLALMQIMGSLATGRLARDHAGTLLYGLQIGLQALTLVPEPNPEEMVQESSCDGAALDVAIEETRSEPYAACATCASKDSCTHIARQNNVSLRQHIDAARAEREPGALVEIQPAPARQGLAPTAAFSLFQPATERVDKFRTRKPNPEPDREALDRMTRELLVAVHQADQRPLTTCG